MSLELLDHTLICAGIEPPSLSRLAQLEIFPTLDSTNTYLLERAKAGAPSGLVCLAEQQTNGRGRLGRVWFSPYGVNIYCSLLWRFTNVPANISSLSIAVAVMVLTTLKKYGITHAIQLKWPNDVLINRRKLAGILLERNDPTSIVIGIGLNLNVSAAGEPTWIDLTEITGGPIARNYLVGLLINELFLGLPLYVEQGLAGFMPVWQQHDMLLNQKITVQTPQRPIHGVMRGINRAGELLLQDNQGTLQQFNYGEVSVR